MATILDGKIIRDKIAKELNSKLLTLSPKPKLVIIQVGSLSQSNTYIRQKILFGQKIGATVDHKKLPEKISQQSLITQISALNTDRKVTGIIVQLPLPAHLDKDAIIEAIDPAKDVDGLTKTNLKLLYEGKADGFLPATTKGILTLLDYYKIKVAGQKVVVVGRSALVGKPTAIALLNRDATVTVCHSKTRNLKQETKNCDILIVAAGKPKLITGEYVSKNQIVIDVGINLIEERLASSVRRLAKPETEPAGRKLTGDVDFQSVSKIVKAISPVPGGIGPLTVASLFQNLLQAYKNL